MIEVVSKDESYLYHAYHITKAFFPSGEAVSRIEKEASVYVAVFSNGERIAAVGDKEISAPLEGRRPDGDEKKERKYRIARSLYGQLSEKSGSTLAWGILTGVRPVKLAMQKQDLTEEAFTGWFYREYLVRPEKGRLAYRIARRERALLDGLDCGNGFSLYVGIPFCPGVCSYCSFSSGEYRAWKHRIDDYLDALCKEIAFAARLAKEHGKKLNTVYIGGGTPTVLEEGRLERLLSWIGQCFSFTWDPLLEYTVEAGRPDSITEEKLRILLRHGVSRISINPQTMQQKTLDAVGRRHTAGEVREAFALARGLGFDNINMDLIAGLPGETLADMQDTLNQIKELSPDNLTVHALAIKRAARMGQEHGKAQTERESPAAGMIDAAFEAAADMGMEPYYLYRQKNIAGNFENVGYAKAGKAGLYNILMMEEVQSIVACGAGSVSKRVRPDGGIQRCENVKEIAGYIERADEMAERKRKLFED